MNLVSHAGLEPARTRLRTLARDRFALCDMEAGQGIEPRFGGSEPPFLAVRRTRYGAGNRSRTRCNLFTRQVPHHLGSHRRYRGLGRSAACVTGPRAPRSEALQLGTEPGIRTQRKRGLSSPCLPVASAQYGVPPRNQTRIVLVRSQSSYSLDQRDKMERALKVPVSFKINPFERYLGWGPALGAGSRKGMFEI